MKDRLITINRRIEALDASITAARGGGLVDLDTVRTLKHEREGLWREMQGLVSSMVGA